MGCCISRTCTGAVALLLLFAQGVNAAGPLSSPLDQNDVEQRQRTLLEDAARQRDEVARQLPLSVPTTPGEGEASGPCFTVTDIRLEGSTVLDAKVQANLTTAYLNTCMGLSHINALIRAVSQWYLAKSYITSRAFLPEQDLAGGILTLGVLEGRVEVTVIP
ncbi:POTRA domain, ShlB-type [compost metagenome]